MITQLLKVATPATEVTALLAQVRTPPPTGALLIARVTTTELAMTLPPKSCTCTTGEALSVSPSTPPPGGVEKASWLAAAGVRVIALLVPTVRPPDEALST